MPPGLITAVASGSLAARAGLEAGDELISVNDHRLRDVIDVRFYSSADRVALRVRRAERESTLEAERQYDEPLGMEFACPTFDPIRRCNNRCEFCFVAQMPPGLRPSLYLKDDDYRYSFLFGNYITLTNLTEANWERISEQHLSPLYVSVHATDTDLRRRLLGNPAAPNVIAQFRRLADLGIEVHTQIVVQPEVNDGPHLERSIADLVGLYPAVRSISVVPVGLTRYHQGGCRIPTDAESQQLFEQVAAWQARLLPLLGVRFAYLSDEWYLWLNETVPALHEYDGLDLTENGVGLVRQFLSSNVQGSQSLVADANLKLGGPKLETLTLVTGELFARVLRRLTADLAHVEVVPVANRFFGETVTVAGLLAGQDVIAQMQGRDPGDVVVLPPAMFGGPEGQSLDEMQQQDVEQALGQAVMTGLPTRTGVGRDTGLQTPGWPLPADRV